MTHNNLLAKNLNFLLMESGISGIKLAEITNVHPSNIKKIRNGTNINPTVATLLPIAKHFSLTIESFLNDDLSDLSRIVQQENEQEKVRIPFLTLTSCIDWPNHSSEETILDNHTNCFALKLHGNDWDIFEYPGIAIIDGDRTCRHQEYVVAYKKQKDSAVVKRLIIDEGEKFLQSPNITNRISIAADYRIIGVIIEFRCSMVSKPQRNQNSQIMTAMVMES